MNINLNDPAAIRQTLCDLCEKGKEINRLQELLKLPEVVKVLNVENDTAWGPLGMALRSLDFSIALLRHGATPLANRGDGYPVLRSITAFSQSCPGDQECIGRDLTTFFHAIIANRLLKNDGPSVCKLLSTTSETFSLFDPDRLIQELPLHSVDQTNMRLPILLAAVRSKPEIDDLIKELFADFCKRYAGLSVLHTEKPEQQPLKSVLQNICSDLVISPYKDRLLEALELPDAKGLAQIQSVTEKFNDNFGTLFQTVFMDNPEDTMDMILGSTSLYDKFLQIYHYYAQDAWQVTLESILIDASDAATKEPVATAQKAVIFDLQHKLNAAETKIDQLTKMVLELQQLMPAPLQSHDAR